MQIAKCTFTAWMLALLSLTACSPEKHDQTGSAKHDTTALPPATPPPNTAPVIANSANPPEKFDYVGPMVENRAVVEKEGFYGFIDQDSSIVVPLLYEDAQNFREGLAAVKENGLWGFIDPAGNRIIPSDFEIVTSFHEGLAAYREGYLWGYIDKQGSTIIPPTFDFAFPFEGGKARVQLGMEWWLIDQKGEKIEKLPEPSL